MSYDGASHARRRSNARSVAHSLTARLRSAFESESTLATRCRKADHFFGKTVHYAARVASHALGGEVLVSNVVHDLVSGAGIDFQESPEVELKGLEGLHRLFALDLTQ